MPSRGSNVIGMPHAIGVDENFALSSAKRQKTKHQPSSRTSSSSMDDALDNMPPGSVNFGPPSQSQNGSRAPSAHSQGSGPSLQIGRSASSNGSLQEYKRVESLMSSDPRSTKRQRRRNSQNQQQNHDLPAPSMIFNPIDISGGDEMVMNSKPTTAPRVPHQGTIRKPHSTVSAPNTSKLLQGPSTRKQLPFFSQSSHVIDRMKQKLSQSMAGGESEGRLAEKFVQIDGKRRDSDVNMSSDLDELQRGGDTVRHLTNSRQSSPTKGTTSTPKATPSTELSEGFPESNIKPTNWAKPKDREDARARDIIGRVRERTPSWAIDVAAISYAGETINDTALCLVYNDTNRLYAVMCKGKPTSFRIQPDKLQTISWGTSGGKARFASSKSGSVDNVLDIEFRKEKDLSELVEKLQAQSAGCKIKTYDRYVEYKSNTSSQYYQANKCYSARMDKMFERRRQDFQKSSKAVRSKILEQDNMQHGASAWQRHRLDQTVSPILAETKRQRTGRSLVDALYDRSAQEDDSELTGRETKPVPNGLPMEKSIPEVLSELKPQRRTRLIRQQDQNSHLRRSTRTSGATTRASEDVWAQFEDVPTEEKHSKVHGLGKAWSKPLTYPREGKKKTTVEFSDLERLDEGEFLNDNLISFYLRFLEQNLGDQRPDVAKRVYFFNTYFFATLTNTHKGKKCFNYEGVQKWTRTVDLFTYDYIIVPINESSHWYLAIICNLPALDRSLELPEDVPSSQTETAPPVKIDESNEFGPPSSSPAAPELAREGSTALVEDAKDETEARNSFAEMSLDNGVEGSAIDRTDSGETRGAQTTDQQAKDQEMLDAQFEETLPDSVAPKAADVNSRAKAAWSSTLVKERAQDVADPIEDMDDEPKASTAKSKKQKRKSMPPSITKIDPNKPAIMLFDSLGLSRGPTIKTLKDYLHEEARTKRGGMEFDGGQIKGINAKVPQQTNFSDCGLFLLGYVAKFLEDDPRDFIAKIIGRSYETKDWSKLVPSTLRANIRDQVQELHKIQEGERQSAKKAGRSQDKNDQKPEPSPTRAPAGQAKVPKQEAVKAGAEPPNKPTEHLRPESPETGRDELAETLGRATYDSDIDEAQIIFQSRAIDDKDTEQTSQETDKAIEAAGAAVSPARAHTSPAIAQDQHQICKQTEVDHIIIDSQSQRGPSARKSLEPVVQDSRPGSRLPSEIADSQPSAPAIRRRPEHPPKKSTSPQRSEAMKSFEKVLRKQPLVATATRAQDTTGEGAHKIVVEIPAERLGRQSDRSRYRKSTKNKLEEDGVQVIDVIDVDD